mmetsp:Transcript_507/g.969  ORF Transcript_507/g.969 Transcript_507/m.969 type:complete len:252 (+) Transcript_507:850-1605(+)
MERFGDPGPCDHHRHAGVAGHGGEGRLQAALRVLRVPRLRRLPRRRLSHGPYGPAMPGAHTRQGHVSGRVPRTLLPPDGLLQCLAVGGVLQVLLGGLHQGPHVLQEGERLPVPGPHHGPVQGGLRRAARGPDVGERRGALRPQRRQVAAGEFRAWPARRHRCSFSSAGGGSRRGSGQRLAHTGAVREPQQPRARHLGRQGALRQLPSARPRHRLRGHRLQRLVPHRVPQLLGDQGRCGLGSPGLLHGLRGR